MSGATRSVGSLRMPQTSQSLPLSCFRPHAAKNVFNVLLKCRILLIVKPALG